MNKLLIFDIYGDYAHFKQFFTTTSPLSFPFPPPPTVNGIIGAIIGLEKKDNYYQRVLLDANVKIAIGIKKSIKKVRYSLNLINTKKGFWKIKQRTQIRTEFIKDPKYRIYFTCDNDDIYNQLKEKLENHHSHYTISLGLAYLLADFEFIGEYDFETRAEETTSINSIVTRNSLLENTLPSFLDVEIFKMKTPIRMNPERVVEKYEDIFYERTGKVMECQLKGFQKVGNGENIVFLS
jgi:CRISPR-associated protein Cas5h